MHDPTPLTRSHREVIDALKRRGRAAAPDLARDLGLNVETLREHLRTLEARDLVQRVGRRSADGSAGDRGRHGSGPARRPGRPSIIYTLTARAEALFPRNDGALLQGLSAFLVAEGHTPLLRKFYDAQSAERRRDALARVAGLTGKARLKEIVKILTEMGYMPTLERNAGALTLRLCHCPVREMVAATHIPCRAEISLLRDLLGVVPQRIGFIPDGADACSYTLEVRA